MPIIQNMSTYAIPSYYGWTAYTPVIPKLYWDVYSQEERIKRLCMEYDKLTHYASMVSESVNELAAETDMQFKNTRKYVDDALMKQTNTVDSMIAELKRYVDDKVNKIAAGQLVYDVTTGEYRSSVETMRRLYQALSYDHKGDAQLVSSVGNETVEDVAEHTVYNVAYSNRPNVVIDDQNTIQQ